MTNLYDQLNKWKELLKNDKSLLRKINVYLNNQNLNANELFDVPKIINNSLTFKYGIGNNNLNLVTLSKFLFCLIKYEIFNSGIEKEEINVWICGTYDPIIKSLLQQISCIDFQWKKIIGKKINLFFLENFDCVDQKFAFFIAKETKMDLFLFLQKNLFDQNIFNLSAFDKDQKIFDINILNIVLSHLNQFIEKEFTFFSTNDVLFLNSKTLINSFSTKLEKMFSKKTNIFEQESIKVALALKPPLQQEIIAKVLGKINCSYVKKTFKKDSLVFEKNISKTKLKWIFTKEIIFAKKNKANLLFCSNSNGDQLFVFCLDNNKIIYLKPDTLVLFLLNFILTKNKQENSKLPKLKINSNSFLTISLKNLCQKYNILFEYSEKPQGNDNEYYLMIFWNYYNQFSFGQNNNIELDLYHIILKIIDIVNYYFNQKSSIRNILEINEKLYGNDKKIFIHFKDQLPINNNKINLLIQKEKFVQIRRHKYNSSDNEFLLWDLKYKNNPIEVKYNNIQKQTIFIIKIDQNANFIYKMFIKYLLKLKIKKLLKIKN